MADDSKNSGNHQRIAKNTLVLYLRMLFMMGVSLFTSRIILQVLGVENFGIYNVVGGIVTMFTFINGGMISATQRFLTFELGKSNKEKLRSVFSTSLQIHFIISLIIFILAETIGLWFLYEKIVLPPERFQAALIVYQCSILACLANIMSVPYNALIIAHEKMSAFAYISILEVALKLLIVYLLLILPGDKLAVYACLILVIQLFVCFIYSRYCRLHFEESVYRHVYHRSLFKEMVSFAGWSFTGNLAYILYTQGLNVLLNLFFGPVVNAARGIAVQVQSVVNKFVVNFQMALNPQITKNYAVGNLQEMHMLMFRSARFSFMMLFLISLPVMLEANYVLILWLKDFPNETVVFTQLIVCVTLLYTLCNPCAIANQATGKVKFYQFVEGSILLTIVPLSYILLKFGAPAYSVFIVHIIIECIAQLARLLILKNLINFPVLSFLHKVYVPILLVVCTSLPLPFLVHYNLEEGLVRFVCVSVLCLFSTLVSILVWGLSQGERLFLFGKVRSFFNKYI